MAFWHWRGEGKQEKHALICVDLRWSARVGATEAHAQTCSSRHPSRVGSRQQPRRQRCSVHLCAGIFAGAPWKLHAVAPAWRACQSAAPLLRKRTCNARCRAPESATAEPAQLDSQQAASANWHACETNTGFAPAPPPAATRRRSARAGESTGVGVSEATHLVDPAPRQCRSHRAACWARSSDAAAASAAHLPLLEACKVQQCRRQKGEMLPKCFGTLSHARWRRREDLQCIGGTCTPTKGRHANNGRCSSEELGTPPWTNPNSCCCRLLRARWCQARRCALQPCAVELEPRCR